MPASCNCDACGCKVKPSGKLDTQVFLNKKDPQKELRKKRKKKSFNLKEYLISQKKG